MVTAFIVWETESVTNHNPWILVRSWLLQMDDFLFLLVITSQIVDPVMMTKPS